MGKIILILLVLFGAASAYPPTRAKMTDAALPIVDNFGAAMASLDADQDPKNVLIGVKMIHEMLEKLLLDSGVCILKAEGETFDPSLHEAVGREETEQSDPNVILREVQRGYRLGDLVIRPSRVVVAAAPATADGDEDQN